MFSIKARITEEVNTIISPSETIVLVLRQSILSSIAPDAVVVTDRRVIIVHHSFWGLYLKFDLLSPTKMNIVPFKNMMSVSITKGKFLATLLLRILGSAQSTDETKFEWDVFGLNINDALKATNTIGRLLEGRSESQNSRIAPDAEIGYNEEQETHDIPYDEKNDAKNVRYVKSDIYTAKRDTVAVNTEIPAAPVAYVMKNKKIIEVEAITAPRRRSKTYGKALGSLLVIIAVLSAAQSSGFGHLPFLTQVGITLTDSIFLFIIGILVIKLA